MLVSKSHESARMYNESETWLQGAEGHAFANLFPAILQCFAIICAGYIAGRAHILSATHAAGLGRYVSRFALPALLFKSMCELNLHAVNWKFLASVLISKTSVFVVVGLVTILVVRPFNTGKAGLYAIFSTQSNDFALGYPIVQAVYGKTHPELLKYIYLIAPISLIFLNPIGFILLEVQKWRNSPPQEHSSKWHVVWFVIKGIIKNPVVFMTALGVIGNFVFHERVPPYLSNILSVLADSYSATALFYLGLSMVGKIQGQNGAFLLTPAMIIIAKTLLLPFVTRELVNVLGAGGNNSETGDLAMYGFLYGTFPTAPSVFLYATYYGVAVDVIGAGMVACTFISAPLMFVSAQMISLPIHSAKSHTKIINDASFDTSIISIICCLWVIGVFIVSRKCRSIPHQFTLCLTVFQCLAALGLVLDNSVSAAWQHYIQFTMLLVGTFGARCCTAVVAVMLLAVRCERLCLALRIIPFMYFYAVGLPIFMVGLLYMIASGERDKSRGPINQYGMPQMMLSLIVLMVNIMITVIALILQQRYDRVHHTEMEDQPSTDSAPVAITSSTSNEQISPQIDIPSANINARNMTYGSGDMLPCPIGSLQGTEASGSLRVSSVAGCSKGRTKAKRIKRKKKLTKKKKVPTATLR